MSNKKHMFEIACKILCCFVLFLIAKQLSSFTAYASEGQSHLSEMLPVVLAKNDYNCYCNVEDAVWACERNLAPSSTGSLAEENNHVNAVTEEIEFQAVVLGGKSILIPVIVRNQTERSLFSINQNQVSKYQECTYYIPLTEEDQEYNDNYIQRANSLTATDQMFDPKHYFTITSFIKYSTYPSLNGDVADYYVRINNVGISKSAEPVGVGWDIIGVGTPSARIVCVGYREDSQSAQTLGQIITYDIPWGTNMNTPSEWLPVICGTYSSGYRGLVQYTIGISYLTPPSSSFTFTHILSK